MASSAAQQQASNQGARASMLHDAPERGTVAGRAYKYDGIEDSKNMTSGVQGDRADAPSATHERAADAPQQTPPQSTLGSEQEQPVITAAATSAYGNDFNTDDAAREREAEDVYAGTESAYGVHGASEAERERYEGRAHEGDLGAIIDDDGAVKAGLK